MSPLDADEKLAAALGRMAGMWSHLEFMLAMIFQKATGMDGNVASGIFDFFRNTHTQRRVLLRIIAISNRFTAWETNLLKDVLKSYVALAEKRNALAHNPFGWKDVNDPDSLYLMQKAHGTKSGDGIPYTTRPVTTEEINALTREIDFCRLQMLAIVTPNHLTLPPELRQPNQLDAS
jgi:hypothetical protein